MGKIVFCLLLFFCFVRVCTVYVVFYYGYSCKNGYFFVHKIVEEYKMYK